MVDTRQTPDGDVITNEANRTFMTPDGSVLTITDVAAVGGASQDYKYYQMLLAAGEHT